jgi:hypothetical protein
MIVLAVVVLSALAGRIEGQTVQNGIDFLNIPAGVRASGMGGAFVAVADDASAAYWNPAGLRRVRPQVLFAHNAYLLDMRQEYVSAATQFERFSVAGSFNVLDVGSIEKTDESGNVLGEFRPFDIALGVSAAYGLTEALSVGGTVKGILSDIDTETATGYLFDVGALWEGGLIEGLSVGFAARNIGPSLTFIEESFDAPLNVRGGVAYRFGVPSAQSHVVLAFDAEWLRGGESRVFAGGEWYYGEYLVGRLGLVDVDTQDFAAGLGARYHDFIIDYAYVPFNSDLGNTQRIGLIYTFRR